MKISFIKPQHAATVLRVVIGIIFISHGAMRIYVGTVGGFGEFLGNQGFPMGAAIAWSITIFELTGGALLALGRYSGWIGIVFIIHQIMGITLVHSKNGWFVVGHSTGGMEYSTLLIAALIVIISRDSEKA